MIIRRLEDQKLRGKLTWQIVPPVLWAMMKHEHFLYVFCEIDRRAVEDIDRLSVPSGDGGDVAHGQRPVVQRSVERMPDAGDSRLRCLRP